MSEELGRWLEVVERLSDGGDTSAPEASEIRLLLGAGALAVGRLEASDAGALAGVDPETLHRSMTATASPRPRLSIVIPIYNEAEALPALHAELQAVLPALGSYEVLFVDDGSDDASADIIRDMQTRDRALQLIRLSRNFGHQAALSAGLSRARGEAVVFMDGDLQDPPSLLPQLVSRWEEGNDVVYAIRQRRKEGPAKRLAYFTFYRILQRLSEVPIPLDSGDFCLLDRRVAEELRSLPERNRFLRGLRSWVGFRQVGVPYDRPARAAGPPKYTTRRLVRLAADGILAFSATPLRVASVLGIVTAFAGLAYTTWAVSARLFFGAVPKGWASLTAIVLIIGGAQLVVTGVLGEYLARVYEETKRRPLYVVRDHDRGSGGR